MRFFSQFMIFVCLLLGLNSCGGKKPGDRSLIVSSSFLVSEDFDNGAVVRVENPNTNTFTDYVFTSPPFVVSIPDGIWSVYFIGIDGDDAIYCGGVEKINLATQTSSIDISADETACANSPYPALISKKTGLWDQSKWNQALWGP